MGGVTDRSRHHAEHAHAGLALVPATRAACESAWMWAVTVLGTLVTQDPAYQPAVLPAPVPDAPAGYPDEVRASIAAVVEERWATAQRDYEEQDPADRAGHLFTHLSRLNAHLGLGLH